MYCVSDVSPALEQPGSLPAARPSLLTALANAGRADLVRAASGERLFRYRPGPEHRHYLICTECGLSRPVDSGPVEDGADNIRRPQSGHTPKAVFALLGGTRLKWHRIQRSGTAATEQLRQPVAARELSSR